MWDMLIYGVKQKCFTKIIMKVEEKVAFINFDFTVTEIAENLGVSRQAVKDSVSKAQKKLQEFEEKLSFVKKTDLLNEEIKKLKSQLSKKREE